MTRITVQDINNALSDGLNQRTEVYDIVNLIRNEDPQVAQYVPLANADNVAEIGAAVMMNQTVQNEFITTLVNRIGLVLVDLVSLRNPLRVFKKGTLPQGYTIEQIFVDIAKARKYDPDSAESNVFKRTIPNVKTLFHERNRQDQYPQTIQDDSLRAAFVSWGAFGQFVSGIINSIYNGAEVDEYEYMKLLVDNYYSKGLFTVVPVTHPDSAPPATELMKKLRATALKMTLPQGSRDYNSLAVRTTTAMDDLYLMLPADTLAEIDVDVLAKAFNMDRTIFIGHVIPIEGFASTGLEAVLIDRDFYMVYDNLLSMETIRNPSGLYWNYFYNVWQTLSVSRFANAVAFVSGAVKAVTQVIVDPAISAVKAGSTQQFKSYVRANDGNEYTVAWSVVASTTGTTLQAGTTISADGLLTVATNQTGELLVKATVSVDPDGTPSNGDEYTVEGQSIVSIIPTV